MSRGIRRGLGVLVAVVLTLGPIPLLRGHVAAQDTMSVQAWTAIGSVRPDIGCWVTTTVEVHNDGNVVPGVAVGIGLVVDGETTSVDYGVTGDDGIAWVGFDTSSAYIGADVWLDVLLDGSYAGGTSIMPTEGGACAEDGTLLELWGDVTPGVADDWIEESSTETTALDWGASTGSSLWVPTYLQQRNLSCEYAALSIATGAWGNTISEYAFDDTVGWSSNPHWGFRGDINGWWGNTDDYGVYANALVGPLAQFGFSGDVFYGAGDSSTLTSRLDAGVPTLVWLGLWGDLGFYESLDDGTSYKLTPGYHVVVAYGYDESGVYVSDPAKGDYGYYDWGTFISAWNVLDGMSLAIAPF